MRWSHPILMPLLAAFAIGGVSGCSDEASDASREDASAGDSQAQDQVTPTPEAGMDEGDAEADAPVDDAPAKDAPQGCTPVAPAELASTQTITFRITNARQAEVWVVTEGVLCSALGIERVSPSQEQVYLAGISLPPDNHCCTSSTGCDYNGRGPGLYARLSPGETMDTQWDARGVVVDSCETRCPGMSDLRSRLIAFQPVAGGSYKVSVAYTETLGPDCLLADAGATEASCGTHGSSYPSVQEEQCDADEYATAQFELQEGVDVSVPVTIQ